MPLEGKARRSFLPPGVLGKCHLTLPMTTLSPASQRVSQAEQEEGVGWGGSWSANSPACPSSISHGPFPATGVGLGAPPAAPARPAGLRKSAAAGICEARPYKDIHRGPISAGGGHGLVPHQLGQASECQSVPPVQARRPGHELHAVQQRTFLRPVCRGQEQGE